MSCANYRLWAFTKTLNLDDPTDTLDEIEKKIAEQMGFKASQDDRYKLLEMHVYLDLPGYEDKDEDGQRDWDCSALRGDNRKRHGNCPSYTP
jgi:hypothetical protein